MTFHCADYTQGCTLGSLCIQVCDSVCFVKINLGKKNSWQVKYLYRAQQSLGERQEYTLDRSPAHHTLSTHTHNRGNVGYQPNMAVCGRNVEKPQAQLSCKLYTEIELIRNVPSVMQLCCSYPTCFSKHIKSFFLLSAVWPAALHGTPRNGEWFPLLLLCQIIPDNHRLLKHREGSAWTDIFPHIWRACQASRWSLPLLPLRAC